MREMNPEAGEPPAEVYGHHLESGVFGYQRCAGCGAAVFYPRVLCPFCGSADLVWETSSGRGVVYATTAVYRRESEPYNVALINLQEGFRMMSRVDGVPAEEVDVGARVTLSLAPTDEGPLPVFVPEGEDL